VLKAELELMKGATEASSLDLEQVRNLLDLCTGKYVILITKSRLLDPSLVIICDYTVFFKCIYFTAAKQKLDLQKLSIYL